MIDAAKFDRRIEIQEDVGATKDEYGEPIKDWIEFATVWAAYNRSTSRRQNKEEFQAAQLVAEGKDTFEIRYLVGLKENMRIIFEGETYDIVSIKEQNRRETLLIEATNKDRLTDGN